MMQSSFLLIIKYLFYFYLLLLIWKSYKRVFTFVQTGMFKVSVSNEGMNVNATRHVYVSFAFR
jgi:hypothetical protein